MKHSPRLHLPRWQRLTLYALFALMWLSGCLWWWVGAFWQQQGLFGPEVSPWQARALLWHGVLATPTLMWIGSLLVVHWVRGWRRQLGRLPGFIMLSLVTLLVATGTTLWYAADAALRSNASSLHLALGVALPILLAGHIAWARRQLKS